jgi:hypothetical protein
MMADQYSKKVMRREARKSESKKQREVAQNIEVEAVSTEEEEPKKKTGIFSKKRESVGA